MGRLGIIAGEGRLPRRLADVCQRDGRDFFILGIKGHADPSLAPVTVRLGETDAAIAILKQQGVDRLVMAGAVRRPSLSEMRPDWRTVQVFARLGLRALGDDALLRAVSSELEKEGFKVIGAHEIDPTLITPEGILGKVTPDEAQQQDIIAGIKAAKGLGQLDIGQAVVVQQGIVLGAEAVEGTDALLQRCRSLCRKGQGGVLVKACKPQQDKRFDLPTIGLRTVRRAYEAGLAGIAIEAGASVLLDRDEVIEAADKLKMFVIGFR